MAFTKQTKILSANPSFNDLAVHLSLKIHKVKVEGYSNRIEVYSRQENGDRIYWFDDHNEQFLVGVEEQLEKLYQEFINKQEETTDED